VKKSLRQRLAPPKLKTPLRRTLTALLFACATAGLSLLSLMLSTISFSFHRLLAYFDYPMLLLLNFLPIALLMLLFFALSNRAWIAYLITGTLVIVLGFINYFKILLRGEPFLVTDIVFAGEAAGIVGEYSLVFPKWFFLSVFLLIAGTMLLFYFARSRIVKRVWWIRPIAVAVCVGIGVFAWFHWYTDEELFSYQRVGEPIYNTWKPSENAAAHGFLYSFIYSVNDVVVTEPGGYSEKKAEALLAQYASADIAQRVNVIAVMLESYSDLSAFPSVEFTADAYEAWHALEQESYSGVIVADTFAGGTVNTERAFLTGFHYPQPRYNRNTASFVYYFKQQGYVTAGAHPGYSWFYNRIRINERLGFDSYLFSDTYYEHFTKEKYARDYFFFPDLRSRYEQHLASSDAPYFSFIVTFQNHSPYDETQLLGQEYIPHEGMDDATYFAANNYLSGVADTGQRVSEFVDTFREDEEPVVLLIFGDHKAKLGTDIDFYTKLAKIDESTQEELYTAPYLIWANDAAKEQLGKDFSGEGATISPMYLMTELFDCCGWEGNAWLQALRDYREILPVIRASSAYFSSPSIAQTESSAERVARKQEAFEEMEILQYYMREQLQ
jgi:phosphoglycerol transferase MdoB-like AlkP superfamily enzyme